MTDSEELARLGELHQRGVLSDDEFVRAKARVLQGRATSPSPPPIVATINSLRRSRDDRWLGGVCGGLSRLTGLESWVMRLLFVLLLLLGGTGGFVYLLLWVLVPLEEAAARPALTQH